MWTRGQREVEQGWCTVTVTISHHWWHRHGTGDNRDATATGYIQSLENIIYNNLWRLFYIKLQNTKCLILINTIIYKVKRGPSSKWKNDWAIRQHVYLNTATLHEWECSAKVSLCPWAFFLTHFQVSLADTFHRNIMQKTQRFQMLLGASEINETLAIYLCGDGFIFNFA